MRFSFFTKGPAFVYAGEEWGLSHRPELFEKDPLDRSAADEETHELLKRLIAAKHQERDLLTSETLPSPSGILRVKNTYRDHETIGEFDLRFAAEE